MCACEPGFVCAQCTGTPFDPRYILDEPAPLPEDAFAELVAEPNLIQPQMFGERFTEQDA